MKNLWNSEPAMFIAVIQSSLALAVGFGVKISLEQMGLIMAFSSAVLGLLTRSQVIPTKG